MSDPAVSVIIPTRNRAELLPRALRSALAQQDVEIEVVVVNDGSDDGTGQLLAAMDDPRILVVEHASRGGLSRARNSGMDRASGRWFAFLDDDDLWSPHKLRAQLDAIAAQPGIRWSSVGVVNVDTDLRVLGWGTMGDHPDLARAMLEHDCIPAGGSGVLLDRALIEEAGGCDPDIAYFEDWDLWIRLAQRSNLAFVRRPLMAYRLSADSMSHEIAEHGQVIDNLAARYASLIARHGTAPDRVRWAYMQVDTLARRGERREAMKALRRLRTVDGNRRRWLRATVLALVPGANRIQERRALRSMPTAWRREADAWLAGFR